MQLKKATTTFVLIGILAAHVSIRIMAKDAYLISVSDYSPSATAIAAPATVQHVALDFQPERLISSGFGISANPQQHPIPY